MAELRFEIKELPAIPRAMLVVMTGVLDATTSESFRTMVEELQSRKIIRFMLDMEHISYVNSSGLGWMVRLEDELDKKGGGFTLVKVHPKVKVVLDTLGLSAYFKLFEDRDSAAYYLAGSAGVAEPVSAAGTSRMIRCRGCNSSIRVGAAGSFKCSVCGERFSVNDAGSVTFGEA